MIDLAKLLTNPRFYLVCVLVLAGAAVLYNILTHLPWPF